MKRFFNKSNHSASGPLYQIYSHDNCDEMIHLKMLFPVDYHHSETTATPLMLAAGRGFLSQVEQLLALGASVTEKASNGWTALDWATTLQQQEVVELLETHM